MKKLCYIIALAFLISLSAGCASDEPAVQIAATTLPVYEFTSILCQDTGLRVGRLVTESVSCLHDYTLQVSQMRMLEAADTVVISGAGLEEFLEDALDGSESIIDASEGVHIHSGEHDHEQGHHDHTHETDPHIWLSAENAKLMAANICDGLSHLYPKFTTVFETNLGVLLADLDILQCYGDRVLSDLSCRKIITFHDGFSYFAESFDLTILHAVEEESGSEASAAELKQLIGIVEEHRLPAIFTEENGSVSAANVISAETDAKAYTLTMAMSGDSYFEAMYKNIDTIKEALG